MTEKFENEVIRRRHDALIAALEAILKETHIGGWPPSDYQEGRWDAARTILEAIGEVERQ